MSSYTEEELKGMTRVELRRAAIAVLSIDNKECSNTKSQELIDRILSEQDGGGGKSSAKGGGAKRGGRGGKAATPARGRGRAKPEPEPEPDDQGGGGDVAVDELVGRIDAVGKTVDENHTELKELLETLIEQQAETQRQLFVVFGLVTDLYKFTGEPDELEERLNELDAEWEAQGNEGEE